MGPSSTDEVPKKMRFGHRDAHVTRTQLENGVLCLQARGHRGLLAASHHGTEGTAPLVGPDPAHTMTRSFWLLDEESKALFLSATKLWH